MLILAGPVGLLEHDGGSHPERPARIGAVMQGIGDLALGSDLVTVGARLASREELARVHDEQYLDDLEALSRRGGGLLDQDTYVTSTSWDAALRAAGAGLAAIEELGSRADGFAFVAARPPGHHAGRERGMGFCLLNNVAVAAGALTARGARVVVVDWDVHHGNGTQNIFLEDPTVFYFSIHEHPTFLYPGTGRRWEIGKGKGEGATLNAPMAPGAGDAEYRTTFEQTLEPAVERFRPEIILVSAGFDAHREDPLADLQVTEEGFRFMTRHVLALADRFCGGKVVSILEGGYETSSLTSCIEIHVRELLV